MVTGNFTSSSKVSARAKGNASTTAAAPGTKFTEALALWHDLYDAASTLAGDLKYGEATYPRVCVILKGLSLILKAGAEAKDADSLEAEAEQAMAALSMIEETIPAAAKADPLFREVQQIAAKLRDLVSGYLPPIDAAPITSPSPASQAGGASYGDWSWGVSCKLGEIVFQANAIRALLHENDRDIDGDEGLVGVSFLLKRLAEDVEAMSWEVGDSEFIYTLSSKSAEAAAA